MKYTYFYTWLVFLNRVRKKKTIIIIFLKKIMFDNDFRLLARHRPLLWWSDHLHYSGRTIKNAFLFCVCLLQHKENFLSQMFIGNIKISFIVDSYSMCGMYVSIQRFFFVFRRFF